MAAGNERPGRRSVRATIAVSLALLLVAGGLLSWRTGWAEDWWDNLQGGADAPTDDPAAVAPPPEVDIPAVRRPRAVAGPADAAAPVDRAAVEAAVAGYLADRDLGRHVVAAVAPLEGSGAPYQMVSRGRALATPASTTKVVTTTAALFLLGADHTFTTSTVLDTSGATPRLVLVGGGDPHLLSRPDSEWGTRTDATVVTEKADVVTLARQTARALLRDGVNTVSLGFDDGLFTGPEGNPYWEADYLPDGVVSPISALWVDEGRSPTGYGRVADPAQVAADTFAAALTAAGVTVTGGPTRTTAPASAGRVAAVHSAPLAKIVQRILEVSDNEATEVLFRHVGVADSGDGSFAGGQQGVQRVLTANGIDLRGTVLYDGSGLSRDNVIDPGVLIDVIRLAADEQNPDLRAVLTGLPVAGYTGSLTNRMDLGPADGRGRVRAKTGTLTGVRSLAGIAVDLDGDLIVFAMLADRIPKDKDELAEVAMDNAAVALGACHC